MDSEKPNQHLQSKIPNFLIAHFELYIQKITHKKKLKLKIKTSIHGCSEDVDDAGGDARFEEEEEEAEPKRMPESSEVGREIEIALLVDFSSSYFSVE